MSQAAQAEFEIVRRQKVYEAVAEQIERLISTRLNPGDKLPSERELAELLQVSRGSIRDAIRSLELIGLVEPRQGAGTIVRATRPEPLNSIADALRQEQQTVADLLDFREMLEPPLAARAAQNVTPPQLRVMEEILLRQERKLTTGDHGTLEDAHFHYSIAQASGNKVVLRLLDLIMDLLKDTRRRALQVSGRPRRSLNGHRRILEAITRRDPDAAHAAMRLHIREIQDVVLRNFEPVEQDSSRK